MSDLVWYPYVQNVPHHEDDEPEGEGCVIAIEVGTGEVPPSIEAVVQTLNSHGFVILDDEVMSPDRIALGSGLSVVRQARLS